MSETRERQPSMWERRASLAPPRDLYEAQDKHEAKAEYVEKDVENARRLSRADIEERVRSKSVPDTRGEAEALQIAREGGWEIDALMIQMEDELKAQGYKKGVFELQFKDPRHFTWLLVAFASMGGLLSGLDQSLISGANLYLPKDLGLTTRQNSLVNSGMPLGAIGGALLLSPANEILGRRMAIIIATVLYTIGAALEAGSISYGMIIAGRVILGVGVGLEGGTVPVYVAETVERRMRGNLVSLYQFNIALGEVFGYVVAAIFLNVKGNWRYILGSSLVFSIIMGVG
jgi:Sugar (and other) transporter